jgi:hypothetical protein
LVDDITCVLAIGYVIWALYQATFFDDKLREKVWLKVLLSIEPCPEEQTPPSARLTQVPKNPEDTS